MSVFKVARKKYNLDKSIVYMYILYVNHNINIIDYILFVVPFENISLI